jgi:hypothetical protein
VEKFRFWQLAVARQYLWQNARWTRENAVSCTQCQHGVDTTNHLLINISIAQVGFGFIPPFVFVACLPLA